MRVAELVQGLRELYPAERLLTESPRGQGCCGALAMHGGRAAQARKLARRNLRAFGDDVDADRQRRRPRLRHASGLWGVDGL